MQFDLGPVVDEQEKELIARGEEIKRLSEERDTWRFRYEELVCAVWACPPEEFELNHVELNHEKTVEEAESDVIKASQRDAVRYALITLLDTKQCLC